MADGYLVAIGQRIAKLREAKGLSREELGKAAGTTHVTIGSIETGQSATNLNILRKIATALTVEPYELLKSEKEPLRQTLVAPFKQAFVRRLLELDDRTAEHMVGNFNRILDSFEAAIQDARDQAEKSAKS